MCFVWFVCESSCGVVCVCSVCLFMCVSLCLSVVVFFKKKEAFAGFVRGPIVCFMCGVLVWFVFVSFAFVCLLIRL